MSAKHTPGPWRYYKCRCGMEGCNQYTISVQGSVGFVEADARLIAAAPELLEALQDLCDTLGECGMTEKARAAIAKAEGRP